MCYECLLAIPHRLVPVSVSLPSSVVSRIVKSCAVLECTVPCTCMYNNHTTVHSTNLHWPGFRPDILRRGEKLEYFETSRGGGEESCISLCIGGSKWHMLPQEILFSWLFVYPHHSCSSLLTWLTCSRRLDMLPLHREYNSASVLILCCAVTCYSIIIGANNHVCCYSS